jgi:regulator of sirC expression with transglutaminase-like and TPR domain
MSDQEAIQQFAKMMQREDEEINLAEAALLIARTEYPELDLPRHLARLESMAGQITTDPGRSDIGNILALNEFLFEREKFSGNEDEYDDPRNSFLNDVLDRKKGIPITLSLVYMELARRNGLPVWGVSFPGHFLVKYAADSGEIIIDPFNQGAVMTRQDCDERLKSNFGEDAEFRSEFLDAATNKQILSRMINNLKGTYFRRRNYPRVLRMIEMGQAIDPGSREELRDRGMVHLLMGHYAEARADLTTCAALSPPDDPGLKEINTALARLRALVN